SLSVGASVGIARRIPAPLMPTRMAPAEVDLLALFLTEGSTTKNAGFSTGDPSILKLAKRAAWALDCRVNHRSEYDYAIVGNTARCNAALSLVRREGLF